jgi:ribonuclease P protein component
LRSPAQFIAVTSDPEALREGRRWLSITCRVWPGDGDLHTRFGFTTSRRNARRAVDRNTARRVMREAARRHLVDLDAAVAPRSVDVVLRLKAPVPDRAKLPRAAWKEALRAEADALLDKVARRLRGSEGAH